VQGVKLGLWTPSEKKNKKQKECDKKKGEGKFKQGSDKKKT